MSKRVRTIVIALAAVLVLVGGLVAVLFLTEEPTPAESSETPDNSVTLVDKAKDENGKAIADPVKSLSVTLQEESFEITPDKDGILSVKAYADLPVYDAAIQGMVDTVTTITANRELTGALAPKEYGFDKPQAKVTVTYADGSTYGFELGSYSASSSEAYFRPTDSDKIYLVTSDFADSVTMPSTAYIGVDLVTAPAVDKDDENGEAVLRDITLSGRLHGEEPLTVRRTNTGDSETTQLYTYWVEKPFSRGANDEAAKAAFDTGYTLVADIAAIVHPTAKQLKECGLDDPYVLATLTTAVRTTEESEEETSTDSLTGEEQGETKYYGLQTHTVRVGNQNEDGYYYVMANDLDVIYLVAEGSMPWVEVTYNEVASTMLFLQDITGIQSLSVRVGDNTSLFQLTHDEEADNSNDMLTVKLSGTQMDTANFRNLYQVLMGISRVDDAEKPTAGRADVEIIITPIDERDDVIHASLYQTSGSRYTCVMSDGDVYAVSAGSVEKLEKQLQNYLNRKDVLVY